jgi:hypothetical protein
MNRIFSLTQLLNRATLWPRPPSDTQVSGTRTRSRSRELGLHGGRRRQPSLTQSRSGAPGPRSAGCAPGALAAWLAGDDGGKRRWRADGRAAPLRTTMAAGGKPGIANGRASRGMSLASCSGVLCGMSLDRCSVPCYEDTGSTFLTNLGRRPGPSPFLVPGRNSRYAEHGHVRRSRLLSPEPGVLFHTPARTPAATLDPHILHAVTQPCCLESSRRASRSCVRGDPGTPRACARHNHAAAMARPCHRARALLYLGKPLLSVG